MQSFSLGPNNPKVKYDKWGKPIVSDEPRLILHVVGDTFPPLDRTDYDPNQLWLSFMDRTLFSSLEPVTPKKMDREQMRTAIQKRVNETHVKLDQHFKDMYDYDSTEPQYVLPFIEFKRLSNNQLKRVARKGKATGELQFAQTWDKDSGGGLLKITVRSGENREDIIEWCQNNCRMRFFIHSAEHLIFESMFDAIIGKMRFS